MEGLWADSRRPFDNVTTTPVTVDTDHIAVVELDTTSRKRSRKKPPPTPRPSIPREKKTTKAKMIIEAETKI